MYSIECLFYKKNGQELMELDCINYCDISNTVI